MSSGSQTTSTVRFESALAAHERGFSLIELLIVLTIISTFAAIAIPRYGNSLARYRVDAAATRLIADFDYARTQAITRSDPQSIAFDVSAETYTLAGIEGLNSRSATYAVSLKSEPYRAELVSASFGGSPTVTFDIFGVPNSAGTVVVQVGAVSRTITLNVKTGKASG